MLVDWIPHDKFFIMFAGIVCDASGVDSVCDVRKVCDVW